MRFPKIPPNQNLRMNEVGCFNENCHGYLKGKHELNIRLKEMVSEMDQMNEQLEEEQAARSQLQQKLSKALAEGAGPRKGLDLEGEGKRS